MDLHTDLSTFLRSLQAGEYIQSSLESLLMVSSLIPKVYWQLCKCVMSIVQAIIIQQEAPAESEQAEPCNQLQSQAIAYHLAVDPSW